MFGQLKERGFTLIEIIAVLIILGILALIAIPKYQDIVQEAKDASLNQAIAEGMVRVNQGFADCLLQTEGNVTACDTPTEINTLTDPDLDTEAGDYTLGYADSGACNASITATKTDETSVTRTEIRPFCQP